MNVIERILARRAERREGIPSESAVRRCLRAGHSITLTVEDGSYAFDIALDRVMHTDFSTGRTRPITEDAVRRILVVSALAPDAGEAVYEPTDERGNLMPSDIHLRLNPQACRLFTRILSVRSRMRTS